MLTNSTNINHICLSCAICYIYPYATYVICHLPHIYAIYTTFAMICHICHICDICHDMPHMQCMQYMWYMPWFYIWFCNILFRQGINIKNGVEKQANSKTCVQVQLHAIAQAQGRWNSFPRFWLRDNLALMQIKSKKDWTGDNSCPYEVRSKYYVCNNDIFHKINIR